MTFRLTVNTGLKVAASVSPLTYWFLQTVCFSASWYKPIRHWRLLRNNIQTFTCGTIQPVWKRSESFLGMTLGRSLKGSGGKLVWRSLQKTAMCNFRLNRKVSFDSLHLKDFLSFLWWPTCCLTVAAKRVNEYVKHNDALIVTKKKIKSILINIVNKNITF